MNIFGAKTSTTFGASNRPSGGLFGNATATPSSGTGLQLTAGTNAQNQKNPNNDIEVPQAPEDSVQTMKFNPQVSGMPILLAAGSWDNTVRVWQLNESTNTVEAKLMQNVGAPVMSIDWYDDSSKIFIASADKQIRLWDLASNQMVVVGQHDDVVRTCNWVQTPSYSCLMTSGWDRTLRFWDVRQLPQQSALSTIQLGERAYCADVMSPLAIVGLSNRHMKLYRLDSQPQEFQDTESPLKFQSRCVSIFRNKLSNQPHGYALGSIEGRVAIQYVDSATTNSKENFTFKCHRSAELINNFQEIYPVNDMSFHPQHNTLATVGSDGRFCFWDKDSRSKLKNSEAMPLPITQCHISPNGMIFAYAVGYDWSRGHEGNIAGSGSKIFLRSCMEEMRSKTKK